MSSRLIMFIMGHKMGLYSVEYRTDDEYRRFVSHCYNDYLDNYNMDHSPEVALVVLSDHPVVRGFVLDKLKANVCLN